MVICLIVKYQKPIVIENTCNCIVDETELKNAIIWYSDKPVARIKKIFMQGNYPAVSIHGEKIHVHRLLMMYWLKRKLDTNEHVHHKDHNKLNALKENLEVIASSKHLSSHNKGKKLSKEHRKKIAEANRRRKVKYKKRVNIDLNELKSLLDKNWSINRISKYFGCDRSTIKNRIYEHPHLLGSEEK